MIESDIFLTGAVLLVAFHGRSDGAKLSPDRGLIYQIWLCDRAKKMRCSAKR